eukprot:UN17727
MKDNSVDVVFICDVYHHFNYPNTIMTDIKRALKSDGYVFVIDFLRDPKVMWSHEPQWVLDHVRAGKEVFQKENFGQRL